MNKIMSKTEIEEKLAELELELNKLESTFNVKASSTYEFEHNLTEEVKQVDQQLTEVLLCIQSKLPHKKNDQNSTKSSYFSLMATNA
ncbi:hypothetical protein [Metabacillus litoralis]|uniref:hypothetical protein n=1 Tax=Metabacillus litoralis TaxID=152268 RepID=UPI001CFEBD55|nr:hypothetical protein [Metabacillus litoralis]